MEINQTPSSAVYGLPEAASVGATEEQIQATGIPYAVEERLPTWPAHHAGPSPATAGY